MPFTGFPPTSSVCIVSEGSESEPSQEQFDALVALASSPASFRDTLGQAIFEAYVKEIRPEYVEIFSNTRSTRSKSLDDLPAVSTSSDVWKFITGIYLIWVKTDCTISIDFNVTFDGEHELHVRINRGVVEFVWME